MLITSVLCLVTIVAETLLKDRLIHLLREAGAKGYTLTDAEGEGCRQRRVGDILGANVRIETIVSEEVGERLLTQLSAEYFEKYAVIAYLTNVQVVRGAKYV